MANAFEEETCSESSKVLPSRVEFCFLRTSSCCWSSWIFSFLFRISATVSSKTAIIFFAAKWASSKPCCILRTLQNSPASKSKTSSASKAVSLLTSVVSGRTGGGKGGEHRQYGAGSSTSTLIQEVRGGATQIWLAERTNARFLGAFVFLRVTIWLVALIRRTLLSLVSTSWTKSPGTRFNSRPPQVKKRAFPKESDAVESLKQNEWSCQTVQKRTKRKKKQGENI